MRTTLTLDDDVIEAAKHLADLKKQGLGRALSDLARRGLVADSAPLVTMENGIPVWMHRPGAIAVTSEMVRNLADDE